MDIQACESETQYYVLVLGIPSVWRHCSNEWKNTVLHSSYTKDTFVLIVLNPQKKKIKQSNNQTIQKLKNQKQQTNNQKTELWMFWLV